MATIVKQIKKLSLTVLGCEAEPWDNIWDRIKDLADAFGSARVSEVFEEWAQSRRGEMIRKPVEEFLKVAPGLIQGITSLKPDQKLVYLINSLAVESKGLVTFDREQQVEIGRLMPEHSPEEIQAAFREFMAGVDDFTVKFAHRSFVERAGQLLFVQKRRKSEALSQQAMIERVSQEGEARAAQELSEARKRADAEAEEVPDTLC